MSLLRAASSAYCFLFGRPSMQRLNGAVLHMALRARGYGNFGSLKQTGEDRLLRLLSGAKLCVDSAKETIATRRPKFVQIEYGLHQLFRKRSLFQLAQFMPSYRLYQLLPHGIAQRLADSPESNIYHYSNFVFVRPDIHI